MQQRPAYYELLRRLTVAVLLTVYVGVVLMDGLHVFFDHHHDAHQHCSLEIEASPCHQKVYHNNITQGCDHQTHLIPRDHNCELCDALFADFYKNHQKDLKQTDVLSVPNYVPSLNGIKINDFFYLLIAPRGPPVRT